MNLVSERHLKLESAIRGEVTLWPIQVKSKTEDAHLAKVLTLAKNALIPVIYICFHADPKKNHLWEKAAIILRLKVILAPLKGHYFVVSARPARFLISVSFYRPTIRPLAVSPLETG